MARSAARRSILLLVAFLLLAAVTTAPVARADVRAPASFVDLKRVDPTILHDIRYDSNHNFIGRPIVGYREPLCILTRPAAEALSHAQSSLLVRGYTLKVYDCYRPQRAVDHFVRWSGNGSETMKREFYPRVDKRRLFDDGYIARRSGHSRGGTVDLTLVKLPARPQPVWTRREFGLVPCMAPKRRRYPDNSVGMGTGYDCFDTRSHTLDGRVKGRARRNRLLLKRTMEGAGFENYENEWWHFTLRNERYPDRHFDFPVKRPD
jgi:D-alanyl-D-alanine dipeptidase